MPAATVDFTIEQGATFVKDFVWQDEDGEARDLTGYTARLQARSSIAETGTLVELTTENGGIEIFPVDGRIRVKMSAAETSALNWPPAQFAPGVGVYQLELEDADGFVTRLLKGKITLDPEIVRP